MTDGREEPGRQGPQQVQRQPEQPDRAARGTAAMQKANTAESKATPKQNTELKTKEGQKALEKDLQKKATQ